ncbi:preprotein translocase subunit SecG [Pustulibacterium marinum]|uniref:Protein-export membrane protein SecG n=1 Tax=Pustulibacterium marinum TaxID=1224947 RepID=A0A1I7GSV6_9FLAO|nr:preprotein translocase subunit SecG [Pustulibacterium marinum]SFU51326.1 preprotein translocase subunit SecG [Pustulibacterium marinum]
MSTYTLFIIGILVVCFLLVLVVMVQNPKGGGLSSTFGGSANTIGGVKKTGDFLEKSTWTLASILVVLILLTNATIHTSGDDAKILQNRDTTPSTEQAAPDLPDAGNASDSL